MIGLPVYSYDPSPSPAAIVVFWLVVVLVGFAGIVFLSRIYWAWRELPRRTERRGFEVKLNAGQAPGADDNDVKK